MGAERTPRLLQDERDNYTARKRLPDDVRDEYKRRHGKRFEAKFFCPATANKHEAAQQFREWLNGVDGNIAAIRAERDGTGQSLTPQQARKLAGEWYEWWTARHAGKTQPTQIERWRDEVHDAIYENSDAVSEQDAEYLSPDELWRDREYGAPTLDDMAEALKKFPRYTLT